MTERGHGTGTSFRRDKHGTSCSHESQSRGKVFIVNLHNCNNRCRVNNSVNTTHNEVVVKDGSMEALDRGVCVWGGGSLGRMSNLRNANVACLCRHCV